MKIDSFQASAIKPLASKLMRLSHQDLKYNCEQTMQYLVYACVATVRWERNRLDFDPTTFMQIVQVYMCVRGVDP